MALIATWKEKVFWFFPRISLNKKETAQRHHFHCVYRHDAFRFDFRSYFSKHLLSFVVVVFCVRTYVRVVGRIHLCSNYAISSGTKLNYSVSLAPHQHQINPQPPWWFPSITRLAFELQSLKRHQKIVSQTRHPMPIDPISILSTKHL